ncbi:MAG: nitrogen fixation protein NifH [Nitrososphaerales archaeon]
MRYLALRDLLDLTADDPQLKTARAAAHRDGPIATYLANMDDAGYWVKPGPGYTTKYRGTVWSVIALAQLGASVDEDPRVAAACQYLLDHNLTRGGLFSTSTAPSGTVDCLQGNLCWALLELGCGDSRLEAAFDWLARSVTGEGVAPASQRDAAVRYYAYKCGPDFGCGANGGLSCAWGAVKVMLALARWPDGQRTPPMERAIQRGLEFLLGVDPALAAYPTRTGAKPSRDWWKFGFPVFYVTDLLQNVEALVALGLGHDARLARSLEIIRSKQDGDGRWPLEYDYADKTWVDFGPKKQPNPWVTIRALRVLKPIG